MRHPIQPLAKDEHGVMRFKQNKIVQYLLDHGGVDMNKLAMIAFPVEDQEQFAQLIGYSLNGFSELNYVTDATYSAAEIMSRKEIDEKDARIEALEKTLKSAESAVRDAAVALFRIHPDDLHT